MQFQKMKSLIKKNVFLALLSLGSLVGFYLSSVERKTEVSETMSWEQVVIKVNTLSVLFLSIFILSVLFVIFRIRIRETAPNNA